MKIAIAGRTEKTGNYVRNVEAAGAAAIVTLLPSEAMACDGLLLPGGGDIAPAFYGEINRGCTEIDTELDILQLQIFDLALQKSMPVLGICKGLQIINVGLGGTLIQDLAPPVKERHRYDSKDQYHETVITENSWLHGLYGTRAVVNSAHHQAIRKLGKGLTAVSFCPLDGCIEAIAHESLPVVGVQWHPERIDSCQSGTDGKKVLAYFTALV